MAKKIGVNFNKSYTSKKSQIRLEKSSVQLKINSIQPKKIREIYGHHCFTLLKIPKIFLRRTFTPKILKKCIVIYDKKIHFQVSEQVAEPDPFRFGSNFAHVFIGPR